eukprot:10045258-Lingulodinium_polyedra.AAC.1
MSVWRVPPVSLPRLGAGCQNFGTGTSPCSGTSLYRSVPSEVLFVGRALAAPPRPLAKNACHAPLPIGVGGASSLPLSGAGA